MVWIETFAGNLRRSTAAFMLLDHYTNLFEKKSLNLQSGAMHYTRFYYLRFASRYLRIADRWKEENFLLFKVIDASQVSNG